MDNIEGETLDRLPTLLYFKSLIEYEGSFLDLYKLIEENEEKSCLISWLDCSEESNRWVLLEDFSNTMLIEKFLTRDIPLLEIYKDCKSFIVFDISSTQYIEDAKNILRVSPDKFPKEFFPSKDSFLPFGFTEE